MKIIKVARLLRENEALMFVEHFKSRESMCDTFATGIAQIYKSDQNQTKWLLIHLGVLYLLWDQTLNCFYLKLYSPIDAALLWQQEIYKNFVYESSNSFFQMFEGDDTIFGINYSDIFEADEFKRNINKHILSNLNRRRNFFSCMKGKKSSWFSGWSSSILRRKQCERSLEIGEPTDYKHMAHFGHDGMYEGIENSEIVDEIQKVVQLKKYKSAQNLYEYVHWTDTTITKSPEKDTIVGHVNKMDAKLRPPEISWRYDNDLKSVSLNNQTHHDSKKQFANSIATALAKRNLVQNYSSDDDFTSDDDWN